MIYPVANHKKWGRKIVFLGKNSSIENDFLRKLFFFQRSAAFKCLQVQIFSPIVCALLSAQRLPTRAQTKELLNCEQAKVETSPSICGQFDSPIIGPSIRKINGISNRLPRAQQCFKLDWHQEI